MNESISTRKILSTFIRIHFIQNFQVKFPRKSHINISEDTVSVIHMKTEQNFYIYAHGHLREIEEKKHDGM